MITNTTHASQVRPSGRPLIYIRTPPPEAEAIVKPLRERPRKRRRSPQQWPSSRFTDTHHHVAARNDGDCHIAPVTPNQTPRLAATQAVKRLATVHQNAVARSNGGRQAAVLMYPKQLSAAATAAVRPLC